MLLFILHLEAGLLQFHTISPGLSCCCNHLLGFSYITLGRTRASVTIHLLQIWLKITT